MIVAVLSLALAAALGLALYFYTQREAARRETAVLTERLSGSNSTFQMMAAQALAPIRETLDRIEKERIAHYSTLAEQLRTLAVSGDALRGETARLAQGLRSPNVRGRWGELTLRRVVELAGMSPHCDFCEQPSLRTSDDSRLRPDLVVNLPGGALLAVDAKVPLAAYLEAQEAASESDRTACYRRHAQQVRGHATRLADKSYWQQFARSPEFVVAFLPGEPFFSAALEQDPALLEDLAARRVIIATPTTLIPLLLAVAHGWREQSVAENAQRISELGKELYERLARFSTLMADMQRHLSRTVDSFNKAVGSLESRVFVSARRLQEMGAATNDPVAPADPVTIAPRLPAPPPQASANPHDPAQLF